MNAQACPLFALRCECAIKGARIALAFLDRFSVSQGRTPIIPSWRVTTWFATTPEDRVDIIDLTDPVLERLRQDSEVGGWNRGVNLGKPASQTIPRLNMHLTSRYAGAVPNPRGGIRGVLPDGTAYWSQR